MSNSLATVVAAGLAEGLFASQHPKEAFEALTEKRPPKTPVIPTTCEEHLCLKVPKGRGTLKQPAILDCPGRASNREKQERPSQREGAKASSLRVEGRRAASRSWTRRGNVPGATGGACPADILFDHCPQDLNICCLKPLGKICCSRC